MASGRQSRWLLRRARLHTKTQKETRQTGCLLRLFISSARRKETPCHFIHSSPVNLSVLLNILRSFPNDRAHYTLCFRRSSLTYSDLTYFAQRMLRGKQIFPAQCTARLLIQGYCSRVFGGLYSWSFSIVCAYKKRRTGVKLPFVSFQYAEQLQSHSAKSIQTQSKFAPQKGIVIPYKCYITFKPNYVHRRISPHIGQTAYASEEEIVQNTITVLIYHNMLDMSMK